VVNLSGAVTSTRHLTGGTFSSVMTGLQTPGWYTPPDWFGCWRLTHQVSKWEHPLADFYRGAIFMARGGEQELLSTEATNPPAEDEVEAMAEYMDVLTTEPEAVLRVRGPCQ
jgi:hypothetical protein